MTMFGRLAETLESDWRLKARPSQLPPPGEWVCWLVLTGRGWGKTRAGAEWIRSQVLAGCSRLALVGATAADVRDIMVEGESGILAISPQHFRPDYQPGLRRLTWPNGAIGTCYSADEPDRLRGPQHDAAWTDEIASWRYPDSWDMLMLGLRIGKNPRVVATTTPRPVKLIRDLLAREGKDVAVTRGRTVENVANLAPAFLNEIMRRYEGTRLGRQELDAEVLEDVPGALWLRDWFDRDRVAVPPELVRLVVAIDPAMSTTAGADETGIVVAGVSRDGHAYVIDDISGRMAPNDWASRAIAAYRLHGADRIVAEVNAGGDMVQLTLRTVDPHVSFKAVHASRGKVIRAEPVAALYEQRKVHHVGTFATLEDQLSSFTSDFDRSRAGYSPDRLDALVWALTDLTLQRHVKPPGFVAPVVVSRPCSIPGGSALASEVPSVSPHSPHRPSSTEDWYRHMSGPFAREW
jgi:predicted phage terminase large subunit-like protein